MKTKILTISLLASTFIYSAGFNCKKASTPTEKTICTNKGLSLLDDAMSGYYEIVLNGMFCKDESTGKNKHEQAYKKLQKAFILQREACGANVECIKNKTKQRINTLEKKYNDLESKYDLLRSTMHDNIGTYCFIKINMANEAFAYDALYNKLPQPQKAILAKEEKIFFAKLNADSRKMDSKCFTSGECGNAVSMHPSTDYKYDKLESRIKLLQQRLKALR